MALQGCRSTLSSSPSNQELQTVLLDSTGHLLHLIGEGWEPWALDINGRFFSLAVLGVAPKRLLDEFQCSEVVKSKFSENWPSKHYKINRHYWNLQLSFTIIIYIEAFLKWKLNFEITAFQDEAQSISRHPEPVLYWISPNSSSENDDILQKGWGPAEEVWVSFTAECGWDLSPCKAPNDTRKGWFVTAWWAVKSQIPTWPVWTSQGLGAPS